MRVLARFHCFRDAGAVEGLEKVINGVHIEGTYGVLVIGRGEDNLRQRCGGYFRASSSLPFRHGCAP